LQQIWHKIFAKYKLEYTGSWKDCRSVCIV
jgi:hypothetical protein